MRKIEVSPTERRLVRVLMRWRQASVGAVARSVGVDQGNLSRLIGSAPTPKVGAAKAKAVLEELGWRDAGPAVGSSSSWILDDFNDVAWMFGEVLRGAGEIAILFDSDETARILPHTGVLLFFWKTAVVSLRAAAGQETLIDLLLDDKSLVRARTPIFIESASAFSRVSQGLFAVQELDGLVAMGPDPLRFPPSVEQKINTLVEMLGSEEQLDYLLHDLEILMARSAPQSLAADIAEKLREWEFPDAELRNSVSEQRLTSIKKFSRASVERLAGQEYLLPWSNTNKSIKDDT